MTSRGLFAVLVVAFATLATAHVTLAIGLARRALFWRAVSSMVVVPMAPWWGWQTGMRVRAALWLAAGMVYAVTLFISWRGR